MPVDLPNLFGDGVEVLAAGDRFQACSGPAIDGLVVAIGNRHVHAGIAIGGRSDHDVFFGEVQPPGVVVARSYEFQFGTVGLETKNTLTEAKLFTANGAAKP